MLDDLELFDESDERVPVAFRGTAQYENKIYLSEGLERRENHRMVLEPMIPTIHNQDPWASDDTDESDDEEAFSPRTFHVYEAVSGAFGPTGGDAYMDFKVEKSPATYPAVQKMILLTDLGEEIEIRPRCKPRTKVLRGCVELAIAEWMKEQRKLPQGHPKKHDVQSRVVLYNISGQPKTQAVWLWRGLEQDPFNPNVFRLYL
ncbi:hypothetical protein NP233_g4814 [Leucocoprinus birnbaumii]|uniref:Uncharacterized protein n=1 Tax=Leucocoprinus birnbaumii TaxID=56174 RepID=A0AAD5YWY2_9AGAR|nr:hypothetical protein NP233_g4814 [Leucocoprinus birnbaumii]